jgi:D-lactate dehydrogenase (cytochrome)
MNARQDLRRPLPAAMLDALRDRFAARCSTAAAVREQHGRGESVYDAAPPDAVVFCESTAEVVFVVQQAAAHGVPVIPFGVGSSLEGHLLAVQGGVSIDLSRMTKIVQINAEDLTVTVEAGVTREQLNREIKDTGLFFPIDPGANASLGGMAATRASGTNAVRYGTMKDNVLALTVVTADGELMRTGTRARKSSAGYDLTRLFVGSEGTLGVMTEVTLKLYPLPEAVSAAICSFASIDAAVQTTIAVIQMGVPIARCELLDTNAIRAVNKHSNLSLREQPMLLMEFHGSEASVAEQAATVQGLRVTTAGRTSNGRARRKSVRGCGPRGTSPTSPPCRAGPAAAARAPTPACRSRVWRKASTSRSPRPKPRASRTGSSAMSATATSTSATCWTPTTLAKWPRSNG